MHGHCVILYANGAKFEGLMAHGFKEKGKFSGSKEDSILSYEGEWCRGFIHGKGVLVMKNSTNYQTGITYKGTFDHGTLTGDCVITYSKEKEIVSHTSFVNDVQEGKVNITTSSEDSISGYLMSNRLLHTNGWTMIEPTIPLWARDMEKECSTIKKHY
eukprot:TRINITY_DN5093_c0_g1_i9.p1 TRINITY_DN5093_c0_g1~~TRINITY_DN5093_c0_g1_i9.p1  ORF type:complete len:158 (-),score=27.57 TRINITY_DN5093_c0_g1_i9:195-668(-)